MQQKIQNRTWLRFKKNKTAIVPLYFILLTVFVACFAYILSPDSSPNANTIQLEIATQQPGFSCLFFKKYKENIPKTHFLKTLIFGKKPDAELISATQITAVGDSMIVMHIIDEKLTERLAFPIDNNIPDINKHYILKRTFYLGTDRYGRDILSRLMIGARVSLAVGFIAVILSIGIGVLLGSISAYFAGYIDWVITWFINVIWAIPTLLLVFSITSVIGKGFWIIFISIGLTMWVGTARLIRVQVLSLKELEYIQVAKTMGFSSWRIITRHILPNIMGPSIVMAASNFATAILIEAGLSFLGIGVQPPISSWGLMIKENYNFIITNRPMLAIVPGIAIMLIVLAFNLLGNALRDAMDVKGSIK